MTLVTTIAICGFIGVFGYNRYCGLSVERSLIDAIKRAAFFAFVAFLWSVPLKNWTGNKLDLEPHFRHLIGKGGTQSKWGQ